MPVVVHPLAYTTLAALSHGFLSVVFLFFGVNYGEDNIKSGRRRRIPRPFLSQQLGTNEALLIRLSLFVIVMGCLCGFLLHLYFDVWWTVTVFFYLAFKLGNYASDEALEAAKQNRGNNRNVVMLDRSLRGPASGFAIPEKKLEAAPPRETKKEL
jgi:hypothetical protein